MVRIWLQPTLYFAQQTDALRYILLFGIGRLTTKSDLSALKSLQLVTACAVKNGICDSG
jgi:hypothetical protein